MVGADRWIIRFFTRASSVHINLIVVAHRTEEINVDLSKDNSLLVDISDALSERDKVKYTVHTRTTLPEFAKAEVSVVREHEEFIWLHNCLSENEAYAGFIIREIESMNRSWKLFS
ncbi:unnamed protein product [Gongylonema pulchrum]|uniref:PX domain-containing protein n=1 Tax=Gongylonema pulchrum TaxID=637853 RepID=A0A183EE41_9BILA|nr:unnamed protein product [Gongylonema pulchrum]